MGKRSLGGKVISLLKIDFADLSLREYWPVLGSIAFVILGQLVTSQINIEHLRIAHADSIQVFAPGGVYVWDWRTADFDPFSGGRLTLSYLALVAWYLMATVLMGMAILAPLFRGAGYPTGTS